MLSKRCHKGDLDIKSSGIMRLQAVFDIIPTRLIHFNTKLISLVFSSFDTIITAILPIILGFKL